MHASITQDPPPPTINSSQWPVWCGPPSPTINVAQHLVRGVWIPLTNHHLRNRPSQIMKGGSLQNVVSISPLLNRKQLNVWEANN